MTQWKVQIDRIRIASPLLALGKHPFRLQLGDNAQYGTLGNPDLNGKIPDSHPGIADQTDNHVGMIGQKSPVGFFSQIRHIYI